MSQAPSLCSLYVHIPFCERKCIYCDFYSIENRSSMEDFLEALHREIDLRARFDGEILVETVFLGGGTPSLLTPVQLESILSHLHRLFTIDTDAEVTIEANPGTVTLEKLAAYRSLGVNRLSIGMQSFHDDELAFLGRIHRAADGLRSIEFARRAGFGNVSVDLLYSLPGLTPGRWRDSLETAVSLHPEHISAYSLIVEDHTPLARMVASRQVVPTPDDTEAELYEITMDAMEHNGYEHYEVSNYAKPGFRCRHNDNYWSHGNYLGFGPSAHSFWQHPPETSGNHRLSNVSDLAQYCDRLDNGELPTVFHETLTQAQLLTERIFLGLRSDGFDVGRLQRELGVGLTDGQQQLMDDLVDQGAAVWKEGSLRLTRRGYLLCDEICERLMP